MRTCLPATQKQKERTETDEEKRAWFRNSLNAIIVRGVDRQKCRLIGKHSVHDKEQDNKCCQQPKKKTNPHDVNGFFVSRTSRQPVDGC